MLLSLRLLSLTFWIMSVNFFDRFLFCNGTIGTDKQTGFGWIGGGLKELGSNLSLYIISLLLVYLFSLSTWRMLAIGTFSKGWTSSFALLELILRNASQIRCISIFLLFKTGWTSSVGFGFNFDCSIFLRSFRCIAASVSFKHTKRSLSHLAAAIYAISM